MHPVSNGEIFDTTVRELLATGGIVHVDQETDALLEAIAHGEGSVETALNLLAREFAVLLIGGVCVPFAVDRQAFIKFGTRVITQVEENRMNIASVLRKAIADADSRVDSAWTAFMSKPDGDESWDEFLRLRIPSPDLFAWFVIGFEAFGRLRSGDRKGFLNVLSEIQELEPVPVGTWHRFLISDIIDQLFSDNETLTGNEWGALVDLCARFLAESELAEYDPEPADVDRTTISAPQTSTEYWAWQFGRVAALGIAVDEIRDAEIFEGWDNGLAALSLILGSGQPVDWVIQRAWAGALVTWGANRGNWEDRDGNSWFETKVGVPALPLEIVPTTHLYWIMRIGLLDAVDQLKGRGLAKPEMIADEPSAGNALMLGSYPELGKEIVGAMVQNPNLGDALLQAVELAGQRQEEQVTSGLKQRLGVIWDRLPEDARQHLIDAEHNRRQRKWRYVSLDYANATEAALSAWLDMPKGAQQSPTVLGQWATILKSMAGQSRNRSRDDQWLRQTYDPRVSKSLAHALDVLREARLPGAHGVPGSPLANKTRGVVLGLDRENVFELILRFARRRQR